MEKDNDYAMSLYQKVAKNSGHVTTHLQPGFAMATPRHAIAKHTKVDMIWVAGRSPTLVSHSLRGVATNLKGDNLSLPSYTGQLGASIAKQVKVGI